MHTSCTVGRDEVGEGADVACVGAAASADHEQRGHLVAQRPGLAHEQVDVARVEFLSGIQLGVREGGTAARIGDSS